jgi:general secretion pathway protein D
VPLLGDIPVIGGLFRSENRSRKKTNLMVFLRPVVMRTQEASNQLSMDRYELMRTMQNETQPQQRLLVPVNQAPVLPAPAASAPGRPLTGSPDLPTKEPRPSLPGPSNPSPNPQ